MTAPAALVRLLEPWAQLYGDTNWISTLVVFAHIAALVFAGGLATTLDRGTLRATRESAEAKSRHLDELAAAHRFVLRGLALSFVTGVLLFTADIETYFSAGIYWVKMTLVVLLLVNGYVMTRTERRIRGLSDSTAAWARLRFTALASLVLWFTIALAGVALVNLS
jgi:uncharacterized membrane protein